MWWAYTRGEGVYTGGGAYIRGRGLLVGGLRYCMTINSGTNVLTVVTLNYHFFFSDLTPIHQQFCNLTPDISGVE
jgi:hypothetical protein